jgi:hypothetical protein
MLILSLFYTFHKDISLKEEMELDANKPIHGKIILKKILDTQQESELHLM